PRRGEHARPRPAPGREDADPDDALWLRSRSASPSDRLDLEKARQTLNTSEVELATEETLVGAYPEFELGAVPPMGGAYDRVLVDRRLFESTFIVLDAGTHDESVRLRTGDLLSVAEAEVADLALE